MLVRQNNYPLRDWHFEHMQKTVVKYVPVLQSMLLPIRKNSIKNMGVIGQMSVGISTLISNMVSQEKKLLHFLTRF
jgi:hypothetical protein